MEKLELKHLAPYLPYGLQIQNDNGRAMSLCTDDDYDVVSVAWVLERPNHYKPILRPLDDLLKPILTTGLYKVPIRALKHGGTEICECYKTTDIIGHTIYKCIDNEEHCSFYDATDKSFHQSFRGETRTYSGQYEAMRFLFEHHFDVFGLIPAGLAIDINTLNQ